MIPILMLSIPHVAVGGGYGCWSLGQHSVLKWKGVADPPPQTLGSFGVGGAAFICIYGLQSMMFSNVKCKTTKNDMVSTKDESASKLKNTSIPLHKQSSSLHYQPPKSLEETFHRVGRPIIMRLGAGGVSFFCAGVVQTLVLDA
jgi:hypothetical protein